MKICDVCEKEIAPSVPTVLIQEGEEWATLCPECDARLGCCVTCATAYTQCQFEAIGPQSGLPPVVQQVIRQGPMQMITQVRNPELVKRACQGCSCYVAQKCIRETAQGCVNFRLRLRPLS